MMKLLYIVDGRSPIALNWIGHFIKSGKEVHLVSTYPCPTFPGLASLTVIPVGMSSVYGQVGTEHSGRGHFLRRIIPVGLRTRVRQVVAPLTFRRASRSLREVIQRTQPDLIHAMRIPFEGMIASMALDVNSRPGTDESHIPLLISVWGNDFTLHARSSTTMAYHTRQALQMCSALHTDCQRDLKLARESGFASGKPSIVLPGGGGVKLDIFYPPTVPGRLDGSPVRIINPRGFRAYVRNDTFFHAIPLVLNQDENVHFVCPGMAAEPQAQKCVEEMKISRWVDLLPAQSQHEMADLFRESHISLSITTHDGTPNTLLEALACGCFPIAGDLESLREWITPGVNGLLVDPLNPQALATAILETITQPDLQSLARERNFHLVKERAEYGASMHSADDFYRQLLG
jgi:glycosyltransferase involved in cell wall biosynthesis